MKARLLAIAAFVIVVVCSSAAVSGIYIYSDSCNKCVITNLEHSCGKCSGFMYSEYDKKLSERKDDVYAYYTYTCKKCKHKCYGKLKL